MTILCKILKEKDFYGKILEKNIKKKLTADTKKRRK